MALRKRHGATRATSLATRLFDEAALTAALALASPTVTSEEAAVALFANVSRRMRSTDFLLDWEQGQSVVRRLVPRIARYAEASATTRASLLSEFNELMLAWPAEVRVGQHGLLLVHQFDGIGATCLSALIPFLIPNGWSPHRLGQCQLKACGKWFLRPEVQSGPLPLYCEPKHANRARVQAFRQRQESKK